VRRKGRRKRRGRRRRRGRREGGWRSGVLPRLACLCPTFPMTCGLGNRKKKTRRRRRKGGRKRGREGGVCKGREGIAGC
jgi:hypothetical protein